MKVKRLFELINGYSRSLNDEILFYDSNDNELKLADIDGDEGEIMMIFEQKSSTTEVEEWTNKNEEKLRKTKKKIEYYAQMYLKSQIEKIEKILDTSYNASVSSLVEYFF